MGLEGHSIYTLFGPFVQLRNQHILDYTLWAIKNFVCKGDVHMRFLSINTTKIVSYQIQYIPFSGYPSLWFNTPKQRKVYHYLTGDKTGGLVFQNSDTWCQGREVKVAILVVTFFQPSGIVRTAFLYSGGGGTILDGQLFCHGSW